MGGVVVWVVGGVGLWYSGVEWGNGWVGLWGTIV